MCSVVGCYSGRRGVQRFKLPEDPERRLEWVQFLATVNKQRFKESSWTDITICREHFKDGCFESVLTVPTPSHSGVTGKVRLTLKPGAVPSLCPHSESHTPGPHVDSPECVESVENTKVACQHDKFKTAARGSPVPRGITTNTSDAFISIHGQVHPKNVNADIIREKAALLLIKGKYVVNEKRLLQLFSCKCPLCGSEVKVEKVTCGVLLILNQRCLQCDYRNQWKSQVNASVPTAEDHHLTGGTDVTPETQQAASTDDTHSSTTGVSEIVAVIDEESDPMDETEGSDDQGDVDSDEDWRPAKQAGVLQKKTDEETKNKEVESDDCPPPAPKHGQLCTDCGMFFNEHKPHTCEHKIKPYSCNICGKRCVSEVALNSHSRVHDENYEHRCKYCHVAFKTKMDKYKHEQTHLTQGKPYKCPDCPETFATNKERGIHLQGHRGPRQLKCDFCGIEFLSPLNLQRHLSVHTGVKPFKCSVCQRGFKQPSHLKSHMRLHTGERPYKCQQCDKCFNHNVSLKSHVQRYHTSNSGHEQEKEKINNREIDTGDAEGNGNKTSKDSEVDDVNEEPSTDEEVQRVRADMLKIKKRSTGRPIGRPKRNAADNLADVEEERSEKRTSSTSRSRGKTKNSDRDSDFNPGETKKKRFSSSQNSGKSLGKRRGRPSKSLVV